MRFSPDHRLATALLRHGSADLLPLEVLQDGLCVRRETLAAAVKQARTRGLVALAGAPGSGRTTLLRLAGEALRREGVVVLGPFSAPALGSWTALAQVVNAQPQQQALAGPLLLVEDLDLLSPDAPDRHRALNLRILATTQRSLEGPALTLSLAPLTEAEVAALLHVATGRSPGPGVAALVQSFTGGNLRAVAAFAVGLSEGGELERGLHAALSVGLASRQAIIASLPEGERPVFAAVCQSWDPQRSQTLAELLGLDINPCSAQLSRLMSRGLLHSSAVQTRRRVWWVADPLFAIEAQLRQDSPTLRARLRFAQAAATTAPPPGLPPFWDQPDPAPQPLPLPSPEQALSLLRRQTLEDAQRALFTPAPEPPCSGEADPEARLMLLEPGSPSWVARALALCREDQALSPALHLALAERAAALAPEDWKAERNRARAMLRVRHPDSLQALRRALAANPRKMGSWERLIDALLASSQPEEALALARDACRRHNDSPRALLALGRAALAAGELSLARKSLDRALADQPEAWLPLALVQLRLSDTNAALQSLSQAPAGPWRTRLEAVLRPALGVDALLGALEGLSPQPELLLARAVLLSATDPETAERAWQQAAQAGEPLAWAGLAEHLERRGRAQEAAAAWQRISSSPWAAERLAGARGAWAKQDTTTLLREARSSSLSPASRASLAQELARRGQTREALALLRALPLHPDLLSARARLHLQQGDWDEAQALWRDALTLNPQHLPSRLGLAALLARLGDSEPAAALLAQDPDPRAQASLAAVLALQGAREPARALLHAACDSSAELPLWRLRLELAVCRGLEDPREVVLAAQAQLQQSPEAMLALYQAWWEAGDQRPNEDLLRWVAELREELPEAARRLHAALLVQDAPAEALALLGHELALANPELEVLSALLPILRALENKLGPGALVEILEGQAIAEALQPLILRLRRDAGEPVLVGAGRVG